MDVKNIKNMILGLIGDKKLQEYEILAAKYMAANPDEYEKFKKLVNHYQTKGA